MRILFFGDVADWGIEQFSYHQIPVAFREAIEQADLVVYNLEGPIVSDPSRHTFCISRNAITNALWSVGLRSIGRQQPRVFSSPRILELLKANPHTVVSLANNHIKDCGYEGFVECCDHLTRANIDWFGAGRTKRDALQPYHHQTQDARVIFLGYNYIGLRKGGLFVDLYGARRDRYGAAYASFSAITQMVHELKQEGVTVVLTLHYGRDMAPTVHAAGIDLTALKNIGADLVIIHHAHQRLESNVPGVYCLGDFVFHRPDRSEDTRTSSYLMIDITDGKIASQEYTFSFQEGYPTEPQLCC